MMKIQQRIDSSVVYTKVFMTNQWNFKDENVRQLLKQMSEEDCKVFQIDTKLINWRDYVGNYCMGVRNYLLKQNKDSMSICRKKMFG